MSGAQPQPLDGHASGDIGTVNVGAINCHVYAKDFLEAFKSLSPQRPKSPVPFYLLCHAIELGLKSFLLAQRVTDEEIRSRKLGHDLVKIHSRAVALKLDRVIALSPNDITVMQQANKYYASKGFEYLSFFDAVSGFRDFPELATLENLAVRIVAATHQTARDALHTADPVHK